MPAPILTRPMRGDTPLHVAGQLGISRLALMLLEAGADPRLRNARGALFTQSLFDREDAAVTAEEGRYRAAVRSRLEEFDNHKP